MSVPDLLTTREAAELLGVNPHTIHNAATRGKLKRYGTRRQRLWSLKELAKAFMADPPPDPFADP